MLKKRLGQTANSPDSPQAWLDDSRNRYYLMVFLSELLHFIGRNTKSYRALLRAMRKSEKQRA